jgi:hypothetical protein
MPQPRQKAHGQGVVEYAGALVTGAVIISAAIAVGPPAMQQVFTDIRSVIDVMFTSTVTGIQ